MLRRRHATIVGESLRRYSTGCVGGQETCRAGSRACRGNVVPPPPPPPGTGPHHQRRRDRHARRSDTLKIFREWLLLDNVFRCLPCSAPSPPTNCPAMRLARNNRALQAPRPKLITLVNRIPKWIWNAECRRTAFRHPAPPAGHRQQGWFAAEDRYVRLPGAERLRFNPEHASRT